MIVLGIDPGYAIVGWGVVRYERGRFAPLDFGAVLTPAGMDFSRRLEIIYDEMAALIAKASPDAMAVEKLYFKNNQKTAIDVAQARGVILLAAQKQNIPLYEYTPLQVKRDVYKRQAEDRVNEAVREAAGQATLLVISHKPSAVLRAEHIVVMDDGRVVDAGTHEELRARNEFYRKLAREEEGIS